MKVLSSKEFDLARPAWFRVGRIGRLLMVGYALASSCAKKYYECDPARVFVLIVVRDIYSPLQSLVQVLHSAGIAYSRILLLDSGASVPSALLTLDRLSGLGCKVIKIDQSSQKYGPYVLWMANKLPIPDDLWSFPFILTDPDLDIRELPEDWLKQLFSILNEYRWASKAALGLRTDDIDCEEKNNIRSWESGLERRFPFSFLRLFVKRTSSYLSLKSTDTTFSLYRPSRVFSTLSVRLEGPYSVRHLPWYQYFLRSGEFLDYQRLKLPSFGHWSKRG